MIDTNIIVDVLRGNMPQTIAELDSIGIENVVTSVICVAEIYFGMKHKERKSTQKFINALNIYDFGQMESKKLLQLMLGYKDYGITLPDAMIAAACMCSGCVLYTHNTKDFVFIKGLKLYKPQLYST
jgi:predicted nucleic acid-binding protein